MGAPKGTCPDCLELKGECVCPAEEEDGMEPESLTPEIARHLALGSVAALKPGDVLAVRLPVDTNASSFHRAALYGQKIEADTGVKVVFIPGEEFARVATPEQVAEAVRAEIARQVRATRSQPAHVSVLGAKMAT